jgi:hypothetical protein
MKAFWTSTNPEYPLEPVALLCWQTAREQLDRTQQARSNFAANRITLGGKRNPLSRW